MRERVRNAQRGAKCWEDAETGGVAGVFHIVERGCEEAWKRERPREDEELGRKLSARSGAKSFGHKWRDR